MRAIRIRRDAVRLAAQPDALAAAKRRIDDAVIRHNMDQIGYWTDVWYKVHEIAQRKARPTARDDARGVENVYLADAAMAGSPSSTLQVRLILAALAGISSLDRRTSLCVAIVGLMLVVMLDWLTGAQCNLLAAYLVIVGFASWTMGDRAGAVIALVATSANGLMVHAWNQGLPDGFAMHGVTEAWDILVHLVSLLLFAGVTGTLRETLRRGRWRPATR
jgi:hypothetical protein